MVRRIGSVPTGRPAGGASTDRRAGRQAHELTLIGRASRRFRNRLRLRHAARDARAGFPGLVTRVAARDGMMAKAQPEQYFIAGRAALDAVERGLEAAQITAPSAVLDLACGYGRVLRYFRARWPEVPTTASELMPDAVAF